MISSGLLVQLDRLHTTDLGAKRIQRNLSLDTDDVMKWCKMKARSPDAVTEREKLVYYNRQIYHHSQRILLYCDYSPKGKERGPYSE